MITQLKICALILFLGALALPTSGGPIETPNSEIYGHFENFEEDGDWDGEFTADWIIDIETQVITFTVTANTTGFVGFGVSKSGVMTGADIVVGGVYPNGTTYFADRFGISNMEPVMDYSQDWDLLEASENCTHTTLMFSRLLVTPDIYQDIPITPSRMSIMWSFGETDTVAYHGSNRGSTQISFFDQ